MLLSDIPVSHKNSGGMKGWILYKRKRSDLTEDDHAILRLLEVAQRTGIDLEVYKPDQFELVATRGDHRSILIDGNPCILPDFVMPRFGSATSYFALSIVRQLESLGVYSCNSSSATEFVKDKLRTHQILSRCNLPTPKTMLLKFPVNVELVKREIGFPVVVKNVSGMRGVGIYLSETEGRFTDLMELMYTNNHNAHIILQEFVSSSQGTDLRIFVVGGKVIGCMKRISDTSFKANISRGGRAEPFALTPEIERLAREAACLLGLDIAGIDLLFDEKGFKICEANSSPGFKGLEQVVGPCIAEHILEYIASRCHQIRN